MPLGMEEQPTAIMCGGGEAVCHPHRKDDVSHAHTDGQMGRGMTSSSRGLAVELRNSTLCEFRWFTG